MSRTPTLDNPWSWSSVRWLLAAGVAGTIGLVLAVVALAAVNREYQQDLDAIEARNATLEVQLAEGQQTATCRARHTVRVTDAQAELLAFFGALLSGEVTESTAIEDVSRRLSADLRAAKDARVGYEAHPVLPCPLDAGAGS
jgi:hypothetical protein